MLQLDIYINAIDDVANGQWTTLPLPDLQLDNLLRSALFNAKATQVSTIDILIDGKSDLIASAVVPAMQAIDVRELNKLVKELNTEYPEQIIAFLALFETGITSVSDAMDLIRTTGVRVIENATFGDLAKKAAMNNEVPLNTLLNFVDYDKLGQSLYSEDDSVQETEYGILKF